MELQDTRWVEGDSQQMILHFPMDMGELITTYWQAFLYIRESYQQLRG